MQTIIASSKRELATLSKLLPDQKFFYRTSEMAAMTKLLREPGSLVILSGPRDSGKSTILQDFRRSQAIGSYPGVSCMADMRDVGSHTPAGVAKMFKSSFLKEVEMDEEVQSSEDMETFLAAIRSYGFKWRQAFERCCKPAGCPTIIIDEASRLYSWMDDMYSEKGRKEVNQLLEFFVKVTKQEGLLNVVLASSDNFFGNWLSRLIGPRAQLVNVGDLPEKDARTYFDRLTKPDGVGDELWDDIYHHLGGRMGLLKEAAKFVGDWENRKMEMLGAYRREMEAGLLVDAARFKRRPSPPLWSRKDWLIAMEIVVEYKDGVVPFDNLCKVLSLPKVTSLIEYDLLHYKAYTPWGMDIDRPVSSFPLVMPNSRLHLLGMEELVRKERSLNSITQ